MTLAWSGAACAQEVVNLGPMALIHPLIEQLDVANIIDRHLPPDSQLEFSHGRVLSLLLAARLCNPTALYEIASWAERTGADLLYGIPADKLNDDRLGRALDAFFEQRHSVLASVTHEVLRLTNLTLDRLHFDTTHLEFFGAYPSSKPRPRTALDKLLGDSQLPPAHIGHGHLTKHHMTKVGLTAIVDEQGAVPVFSQCLDGSRQDRRAIREQFQLLGQHLPLPPNLLMVSDRGTFSADHVACLYRHGYHALCSMRWGDYRAVYDKHAAMLKWQNASFLSREQQRRRERLSALPHEHYRLAVLDHALNDPTTGEPVPGRLIFVHSSAGEAGSQQRRQDNIAKIKAGLEAIAARVQRGHVRCTPKTVQGAVARLFGKRAAARYFSWEIRPLTPEEKKALPPPKRGHQPRDRFTFSFDEAAAKADELYDGLSVLYTTAPLTRSADTLFSYFKGQTYVEQLHHQAKTPLAVRPVFLKSSKRVEALVCLLQIALQVYQTLERCYRQTVSSDASLNERRTTAETLLRHFRVYGLLVTHARVGRVVQATRLTSRQRAILDQLSLPTPAQTLHRVLQPDPSPRRPDPGGHRLQGCGK
jgi:transposase